MKLSKLLLATLAGMFLMLSGSGCNESKSEAELDLTAEAAPEIVATVASIGDWPQWLGPNRNGVSPATDFRVNWREAPPAVAWRTPLGDGFSGIAVAAGKVYTMYSDNDGEYAVCLDAGSGEVLWKTATDGEEYSDWQGGDGPRATPAINDGIAYFYGAFGKLLAMDANSGEVRWTFDVRKSLKAETPTWGFSASPLIEGNMVLTEAGGTNGKALVALNKGTGEIVWTSQNDKAGYSSPIAVTINDVRIAFFFTAANILAINPENGERLWGHPWKTDYDVNAATPLFIPPSSIFISSEYDVGAARFDLSGDGTNLQGKQRWFTRRMKNKMSTSVYLDGYIYGLDGKILKCIDANSGEEQWKTRGFGEGTLIAANGYLFVLSDRGVLALVEATSEDYKPVAEAKVLNGLSWTAPALAGGRLYLRNQKEMVALDIAK